MEIQSLGGNENEKTDDECGIGGCDAHSGYGSFGSGSVMIPLRFIFETLGYDVAWDNASRTVEITSHTAKALALIETFASGDTEVASGLLAESYIQHNTGIADGVSGLNAALGALAEQRIAMVYDEVHLVLAQGNFVLAVSEGTFGGAPTSYYDLWRVENGKIAEHWDVMETIAEESTWQNQKGKF